MALSTLVVDLILKAGGFESDMGRASKTAQKRMKEIEAGAKKMGVAIGAALAAGATAAAVAIKGAIDRADELYNTAQKIGVTTEALSGLEYAAKMAGVELDGLQGGLAKLVKYQADAAQGGKESAATFAAFGIAIKDSTGHLRDSQSVLLDWAEVFDALPDGAEKTALALRVFGKSGADMIPFLNEGREGITELIAEAERLGLVISEDTGRQADEFNDSLDRLKGTVSGVAMQVATELLPALQDMADDLQVAAEKGDLARNIADTFGAIAVAGNIVKGVIQGVVDAVQMLTSVAIANVQVLRTALAGLRGDYAEVIRGAKEAGIAFDQAGRAPAETAANIFGGAVADTPPSTGRSRGAKGKFTGFDSEGKNAAIAAAASRLLATETKKSTGASKEAAEARRKAAEAAREQAEREKELAEAIKRVTEASAEFNTDLEDMRAELAGPLAEAQLDYQRRLADIRELAATGEVSTAKLAEAEKILAEQYALTTAEIEKRLNPGKQVLEDLQFQIDLTRMATEADRDRAIFLRENINATNEQADAYARMQGELEETREQIAIADSFRGHWEDAFASILDGSKSIKEAFSDLASSILADIARMLAKKWVEQLFGQAGTTGGGDWASSVASLFAGGGAAYAKGGAFESGIALTAFAHGGVVNRPTVFPMARGMGLMGEAGPEAVMPLTRDAQGRLGVRAGGGAGVVQNIYVQGRPDDRTAAQMAQRTGERVSRATARNR